MYTEKPNRISMLISVYYWKIIRLFFKVKKQITGNQRPVSNPYLSGDSFRAIANHIHDETGSFLPEIIKAGDVVFVSNPLVYDFFKTLHKEIKQPYILIIHNGDTHIKNDITEFLDEKIIRVYGQYITFNHEKIIHLPIGLENLHYYVAGITSYINKLREKILRKNEQRKGRIFFAFNIKTNPEERKPAHEKFLNNAIMDTTGEMITPTLHQEILTKYKFVASPRGNGIDSSRTWEALYLQTIPIVKRSSSMTYFKEIGLPLWIVESWNELDGLREDDLNKKYIELMNTANWKPMYMDFWVNKIHQEKKNKKCHQII